MKWNPVMIGSFAHPLEAELARSKLESEGIRARVADANTVSIQPYYSSLLGGVKLLVDEDDAQTALAILAEDHTDKFAESLPRCPLILAAMPEEEAAIFKVFEGASDQEPGGASRFEHVVLPGRLGVSFSELRATSGRELLGPVNAALTAAMICEARPDVDALLLLGVGGALAPHLKIGELVIASSVLQHDSFSSLDFGSPRMAAGSFILSPEDAASHTAWIETDPRLRDWLKTEFADARVGAVLSGSEFVGTVERKRAIAALHGEALLVEMEAAGVAQAARRLGLPFAVAKTVADRLQPDGTIESDFRACLLGAAANAARVVREWV